MVAFRGLRGREPPCARTVGVSRVRCVRCVRWNGLRWSLWAVGTADRFSGAAGELATSRVADLARPDVAADAADAADAGVHLLSDDEDGDGEAAPAGGRSRLTCPRSLVHRL